MKILGLISLLTFTSLVSNIFASTNSSNVIYGVDNRVDVFESTNPSFVELSKSTAAMIDNTMLKNMGNGMFEIMARTLTQRGMCAHERFSKQLTAANCSGFLVAEDVLVTAGHCIQDMEDCKKSKWVFDYKVDHSEQSQMSVPETSIYSCREIIERKLESFSKDDYAVVRLERKVTDRLPLKFRRTGKVSEGESLVVIGHPTGLPTKIADDAQVRRLKGKFFKANLDTYGGNSGSAVFNAKTEEVEGILVRGETDYVRNSSQSCEQSNVCSKDGCKGEDVTFITNIAALNNL